MLIQGVAVGVYPGLASAGTNPLAEAASRFLRAGGGSFMAVGAVISMIGYNAGDALGCPRLLSALAEDKLLPVRLALPHPRFGTPSLAILVTIALTAAAVLCLSFQSLVDLANLAVILQYLATCAALIRLRQTAPAAPRRFRIPFGVPIAIAGCAVSLWLAKEADLAEFLLAGAVMAVGFLAWWFCRLAGLQGANDVLR
jgi:amino acid transporter